MKKNFYFAFFALLLLGVGCQKTFLPDSKEMLDDENDSRTEFVLGKKLKNPYSVTNMRTAFESLSPLTKSTAGDIDEIIQTTHLYVKFKPKTEEELSSLLIDTTLVLYAYPLDYEIESYGDSYYKDPEVPEGQPTYYYAAVLKDKVLPSDVEWEILEELCILDEENEDGIETRADLGINNDFVDALMEKSLTLTGNNDEESSQTKAYNTNWKPSGRITYVDPTLGTIGLEGVEVKAKRWFTTYKGYTNQNGYYSCNGTFKRPADYSFTLSRKDFIIRGKGDGLITYSKKDRYGSWDKEFSINSNKNEHYAATAFRATYHFYYKDIHGLHRPPMANFWGTQLKIKLFYSVNPENANTTGITDTSKRFMGGNMIKIYNPDRSTTDIYATVIHELAHAAHWRVVIDAPGSNRNRDFNNADDRMVEAWACGVQWYLTKDVYPSYLGQRPRPPYYINVVMDLIDDSTNDKNPFGKNDNVTGYDIVTIQNALIGCNTWDKWKNKVKALYNENEEYTVEDVNDLFDYWYNY